jgi:ADP-heptose:LPS heptosyltransferase
MKQNLANKNKDKPMILSRECADPNRVKRILLGQLASLGDCLYATTVARQIKKDFPSCHLTWAIGSLSLSILAGNPDVNDVWEVPMKTRNEMEKAWWQFEREALTRKERGDFDEVYFTQIHPGNLQNYDGTIRSSIFNGYPNPITVSVQPVIRLSDSEIENVRRFSEQHRLNKKKQVILFETAPESGQSFINPKLAATIAERLTERLPDIAVILSSKESYLTKNERIIDGSVLSFRENAELTKYCSLLIGCSSGISWLSTSDWARTLPMVQLLKMDAPYLASFVLDHEKWGLPTNHIIEMTECSIETVVACVIKIISDGILTARKEFHKELKPHFKTH